MTARRSIPQSMTPIRERKQVCFRLDTESQEWLEREALVLSSQPPFRDITVSDVLRFAVRKYREANGDAQVPKPRPPCDIVEGSNGKYCTVCFSRSSNLADDDSVLCRGSTR